MKYGLSMLYFVLGYFSSITMFPLFATSGNKGPGPKQTIISTSRTKLRNVYLVVISEFCLSAVFCCLLSAAYTSLCRDLKYLLKVKYIILVYPSMADFSQFFGAGSKHNPMSENNLTKMICICVWKDIISPNFHRICV